MAELDVSEITSYLYISSFPGSEHLEQIRTLGIKLIISMYLRKPDKGYGEPPLTLLWMPVIDSFVTPIPITIFQKGVQAALPVIDEGGKVLVHCKWGIHRSAAMACCILIAKGYSLDQAVERVKSQRAAARPEEAYVLARIQKFEEDWNSGLQKSLPANPH